MIGDWQHKTHITADMWRQAARQSDMRFRIAMNRHHPGMVPEELRITNWERRPEPPKTSRNGLLAARREVIRGLLEKGHSLAETAQIMGVEKRSVKEMARRWGWGYTDE